MSFFSQFPLQQYSFTNKENGEKYEKNIVDIFRYATITKDILQDATNYLYFEVDEGDRPDVVSQQLYGTPDYYWTFFIINDTLANGLKDWVKGTNEFEEYIQKEYDRYSIMTIEPSQQSFASQQIYVNSLLDINFDHEYIRIRNKNSSGFGIVKSFDHDLMQLKIESFDKSFLGGSMGYYLETFNPYDIDIEPTKYEETHTKNIDWLKSLYEVFKESRPDLIIYFEGFTSIMDNESDEYFLDFEELILRDQFLLFPSNEYESMRDAPRVYIEEDGDISSLLDGATSFLTNYQYEEILNFDRRRIKTIHPSAIQQFGENFKKAINE